MPAQQPTAVVKDLEQRREQLTWGPKAANVFAKIARPLLLEVERAAVAQGISVADYVRQALLEKIVNDEMKVAAQETLEEARSMKPEGISDGHWNERVCAAADKLGKRKRK